MRLRRFCCVVLLVGLFLVSNSGRGYALQTMLNSIPTTETIASKTFGLMLAYYKYDFNRTDAPKGSGVYGIEYGLTHNIELGFDFVGSKDFENAALYPTAFNFKWRPVTQDKRKPLSVAVGVMYLGPKKLDIFDVDGTTSVAYKSSPYLVIGHSFKNFRVTLGYQKNLAFYSKVVDTDGEQTNVYKNDDFIAGIDGVLVKSENHPLNFMVDYIGGYQAIWGIGFYQPITKNLTWCYDFYTYSRRRLPLSDTELPNQHWFSLTYTFTAF